jgi:hypothetical protein
MAALQVPAKMEATPVNMASLVIFQDLGERGISPFSNASRDDRETMVNPSASGCRCNVFVKGNGYLPDAPPP